MGTTSAMANRFTLSDEMWNQIEPLLPDPPPRDPRKGGRPRADDRRCMEAIFFRLRTGCQWNALDATGICPSSTAHDRYKAWERAGVFRRFWAEGLTKYDELKGIDWSWCATDGAMNKSPLGGGKNRAQPHGSRQARGEAVADDRCRGRADRGGDRRGQSSRHEAARGHARRDRARASRA